MIVEQRVRLTYPKRLLHQPLIHGLIRQFDLLTNILEAQVSTQGGYLLVTVRGENENVQQGLAWMAEQGVGVQVLSEIKEEA
jgi:L-aspartate semialdehyde sulfurtransferase ferredoxin